LQATQKKKNSENCPSNQVTAAAMTSAPDEKWRTFNFCLFQGTDGNPTGPDLEDRASDQGIGGQIGQFFLDCKCPVSQGLVAREQDTHAEIPAALSFKISFSCTSRDE
jgi:hypothetical protein